jgi:hypothetical protein
MKITKFIECYSKFKKLRMTKVEERIIIQRFVDSFDDELDYSKWALNISKQPSFIRNTEPLFYRGFFMSKHWKTEPH